MLIDRHGRQMTYLRLAVTDRCNLRCRYCMPAEGIAFSPKDQLLTYDEILQVVAVLADRGVRKIRLTGGEPLVRKELTELVGRLNELVPLLAMTTNGVLLPKYVDQLINSGLHRFNISLDTLREDRFNRITRRDEFGATKLAIDLLLERDLYPKINVVIMRGVNDDEIPDFVALTKDNRLDVRFIEAMPFNDDDGNRDVFMPFGQILEAVRGAYPEVDLHGTAEGSAVRFSIPGHAGRVSIIPAYSRSLCGSCDRLRLTPKGTLLNCLYSTKGLELLPLLRAGIADDDLGELIQTFVYNKHATGHDTERSEQRGTVFASMTSIGG